MITCPNCGAQNDPVNRFCDQCGTRLDVGAPVVAAVSPDQPTLAALACPECSAPVLPGEAFCDNCGADLSGLAAAVAVAPPAAIVSPEAATMIAAPTATAEGVCYACGAPVLPGERFCDNCGADLSVQVAAPAALAATGPNDATILAPAVPIETAPAAPAAEAAPTVVPIEAAPAAPAAEAAPAVVPIEAAPTVPAAEAAPTAVPIEAAPAAPATEAAPTAVPIEAAPTAVPIEAAPAAPAADAGSAPVSPDDATILAIPVQAEAAPAAPAAEATPAAPATEAVPPAVDQAAFAARRAELEGAVARQQQIITQFEQMQATFGAAAPAAVTTGLAEAQAALAQAEAGLAALGVPAAPVPAAPAAPAPAALPPAAPSAPAPAAAAPVAAPAPPTGPRLVVADGGTVLAFAPDKSEFIIGREDPVSNIFPEIDLTPFGGEMGGVSRQHARIISSGDQWTITDLNSTNYTRLDGARLEPNIATPLHDGAKVQFGRVVLTFHK